MLKMIKYIYRLRLTLHLKKKKRTDAGQKVYSTVFPVENMNSWWSEVQAASVQNFLVELGIR